MSWIPGFILVLIHHGIFEIYKNILGGTSQRSQGAEMAGTGGSLGFCERSHVIAEKMTLFDVDSSTLPFLVEEG